jgi:DNA-binding NarL/FixJ family response regulator
MENFGRVLIADRHLIFRAGVRQTLEESGFLVVGESVDGASTLSAAARLQPDACLLDTALPGGFGDIVRKLRRAAPPAAVIALAEAGSLAQLLEAFHSGASGFLVKDLDLDQLPRAVAAALRGEVVIPRRFHSILIDEIQSRSSPQNPRWREAGLTNRERQVVDMLRAGWSTSRIAVDLVITPRTVRAHAAAALRKLHLPNRMSLLDITSSRPGAPPSTLPSQRTGRLESPTYGDKTGPLGGQGWQHPDRESTPTSHTATPPA